MAPAFLPGDRLLVDTAEFTTRPPHRGEVVVLRDPDDGRRLLLKRVAAVEHELIPGPPGDDRVVPPGHVYVLSDASREGRDSRRFGALPLSALLGPVWSRYAPLSRRGPVPP